VPALAVPARDEILTRRLRLVFYTDQYADDVYRMVLESGSFVAAPKEPLLAALLGGSVATFVGLPHTEAVAQVVVTLRSHARVDRHAELGVVATRRVRASGIAIEAVAVTLAYAFNQLDLRKVYVYVNDRNRRQFKGVERYAACEGVLRGHQLRDGEALDVSIYAFYPDVFLSRAARHLASCGRPNESETDNDAD
jgi:hypothetical protein